MSHFLPDQETVTQLTVYHYVLFYGNLSISGIGQKFAVLEIKSLVSKVLRYFEISLAENSKEYPTLLAELILIPESKINFHVKPRTYY